MIVQKNWPQRFWNYRPQIILRGFVKQFYGLNIAKVSNLGKPSWKAIQGVLGGKIDKGSVLVTDSFRGYHKLANEMEVTHIRIHRKKAYK